MQEMTRRAGLVSAADPPFIPPRMRPPDPVMLLLHRFEGMRQMIDSNAAAQRHFEASGCLKPDENPEAVAAIERTVEASHRQLSNAQIELVSTRATSYEGVLGKARYAWYLAADTTEEQATGPDPELTAPLDSKAFVWSIIQDLGRLVGKG